MTKDIQLNSTCKQAKLKESNIMHIKKGNELGQIT